MQTPFYDPNKSYEENYKEGPFGKFREALQKKHPLRKQQVFEQNIQLFGHKLNSPFGIPAGPLLNANFVSAAFLSGFDICVYKTVRSKPYPCHPHPNVLAVHVKKLSTNRKSPLVADTQYDTPLSITNSFGVPSADPKIWQKDMKLALKSAKPGQVMIGSFQGTSDGLGSEKQYIQDFVNVAQLVKETGVPILEANLSCPNEGSANLLCFDLSRTVEIAKKIKLAVGKNTPLILKLAYFDDNQHLEKFVKALSPYADGFSAINTIPATIVDKNNQQALPGLGRTRSGVCGSAITWAGLDMVKRLAHLRKKLKLSYTIIGVGGVTTPQDFYTYRQCGADIVMSATGAMWNTNLAKEIKAEIINTTKIQLKHQKALQ